MEKPNIGIIDVPFGKGQQKQGVEDGPRVMRQADLLKRLKEECNADVKDYGSIQFSKTSSQCKTPHNLSHYNDVINCNKQLAATAETIIREKRTCLTLGGDHSIAFGSISGHCKAKQGKLSVLWVDAHADINTDMTTRSGNMHGMPVALVAQEIQEYWETSPALEWHTPCISLKNIAYIGLRAIDPDEEFFINKFSVANYDMGAVQKHGINVIVAKALEAIDPKCDRSLHLSFDIDAIDPEFAGSTGTPVAGGLSMRDGFYIANALYSTGRLGAMDMAEVNPKLGDAKLSQQTVNCAVEIITAAFGSKRKEFSTYPQLPKRKS